MDLLNKRFYSAVDVIYREGVFVLSIWLMNIIDYRFDKVLSVVLSSKHAHLF